MDRISIYLGHFPAGSSLKDITHFVQLTRDKDSIPAMKRYDYGPIVNKIKYGQELPPAFPLENIKEKVHLFVGNEDRLATKKDALNLCKVLKKHEYYEYKYGHASFMLGYENSYIQKVLEILESSK